MSQERKDGLAWALFGLAGFIMISIGVNDLDKQFPGAWSIFLGWVVVELASSEIKDDNVLRDFRERMEDLDEAEKERKNKSEGDGLDTF